MIRFLLLCGALPLLAQGPASSRNPFLISRPVPEPAAIERGKALFVSTCGFCHGSNATGGDGGPDLVRSAIALRDEAGNEIGPVIHSGKGAMPAFPQMTEAQIRDIAAFIRNRQQDAIDRDSYAVKNVNTGDASRGASYFAAHCESCHAGAADVKAPIAGYDDVTLIAKILYPGGRGPGARPTATVTVAGKATSGRLEYLDDFEIGLRDESGEYHGFTRAPSVKIDLKDPLAGHEKLMKAFHDRDLHDVLAYLRGLK